MKRYYVYRLWSKIAICTNPDCNEQFFNHLEYGNGSYLPGAMVSHDGKRKCHTCQHSVEEEHEYELKDYEQEVFCHSCEKRHVVLHIPGDPERTDVLPNFEELKRRARPTDHKGVFRCWDCKEENQVVQVSDAEFKLVPVEQK